VPPHTPASTPLIDAALAAEEEGVCVLQGVYSHAGHSYAARGEGGGSDGKGQEEVWGYLVAEVGGLVEVAREIKGKRKGAGKGGLVLSVGATPTATVVQERGFMDGEKGGRVGEVERLVGELRGEGFVLEVHAGV
jgi:D-serine deaminase-like pyridoxal phosphate-dependent protein